MLKMEQNKYFFVINNIRRRWKKVRKLLLTTMLTVFIVSPIMGCNSPENTLDSEEGPKDTTQIISSEERQRIDLYTSVMKSAFQEENGGTEFVAVKLDTLEGLSDQGKEEVLKELSSLSSDVYSFEDIKNDKTKFKLDDNGRLIRTIDGALLWVEIKEYNKNKAKITGVSWFGNLGAVFPEYEATFKNGTWQLKLINMAVS